MKKFILIVISFTLIACAGQSTAPVSKQERAANAQSQRDLAFQELDEGETPYVVKTKLTPSQQKALEAHRELDCSIKGTCPLPQSDKPEPVTPVLTPPSAVETPVTVSEKPRPGNTVALAERPGKTAKYPILNGFPVWFSTPIYDGYFGGVGVAKPQRSGGLPAQRKVAVALAQADLARNIEVTVNSVAESERTLTGSGYAERFSTMSRQETEQLLANPTVMDEWYNETTGELYVWVVIK
jgi:hypothetical protein